MRILVVEADEDASRTFLEQDLQGKRHAIGVAPDGTVTAIQFTL